MKTNNACIIVTFRKPKLLQKCIQGVISQTHKPNCIIIVDNKSEDSTPDLCKNLLNLKKNDSYEIDNGSCLSGQIGNIKTYYLQKNINDGGAGGFYDGIEFALNNTKSQRLWLMDDDGIPEVNCLKNLTSELKGNMVLNPIVLDIENPDQCSFLKDRKGLPLKYSDIKKNNLSLEINPFNGTYLPISLIKEYGNVKKEMFIWGDEMEFTYRMQLNKIPLKTVVEAKHFHPRNKKNEIYKLPLNIFIRKINNEFFEYVYYRNRVWNDKKYSIGLNRKTHLMRSILDANLNSLYHLLRFNFKRARRIQLGILHGILGNFNLTIDIF